VASPLKTDPASEAAEREPSAPSEAAPYQPPPSGIFASLQYRNLRLLWIGQTGHAAALWMEQIARPWLVLVITDDNPAHLGGVVAVRVVPQLLFGVWAGVIADWFDRKTLLFGTKLGVFILNVLFAVLLVSGQVELWHIYAVSFTRGIFMAFDQPARQSLIADSVPASLLTNAVALMSSTQNFMRIAGVMASGLLLWALGINGTFITIAAVYFVTVVATKMIDVPAKPRQRGGASAMRADLLEGFRFAWSSPPIRGVLALSLVFYGTAMMWMQLFAPLFARTVLNTGELGIATLVAVGGAGSLLGSLQLASTPSDTPGRRIAASVLIMGGFLMAFGASPWLGKPFDLIATYAAIFGVGLFHGGYLPLSHSILLTASPEHLRGRVISLVSLDRAMTTVGAAGGGLLAAGIGAQSTQLVFGALTLAGGVAVLGLASGLRDYRMR
jgi:MFS family permease